MPFGQLKSALAVAILAGLAAGGQSADRAHLGPLPPAAEHRVAQAQEPSSEKPPPKKKSKTRRPSPCGPGSAVPDCPSDGKSSSAALRLRA